MIRVVRVIDILPKVLHYWYELVPRYRLKCENFRHLCDLSVLVRSLVD